MSSLPHKSRFFRTAAIALCSVALAAVVGFAAPKKALANPDCAPFCPGTAYLFGGPVLTPFGAGFCAPVYGFGSPIYYGPNAFGYVGFAPGIVPVGLGTGVKDVHASHVRPDGLKPLQPLGKAHKPAFSEKNLP